MKVSDIKSKVAAKVAKGKAKVAKKCGKCGKAAKCAIALALLAALGGCQNPAQRAQNCEVNIYAYDASRVTLGTESVTLAQSNETGGNDAGQTATPTTEVKTDLDLSVPVNKANAGTSGAAVGALERVAGAAADYVAGKIGGGGCADGGECSDGECAPCAEREKR